MPMPLSSRVAVPDGGKLAGMRMIVVSMPCSLEHLPERLPAPQQLDAAARQRELPLAERRSIAPPASVFVVDRYGIIVFGSRWMKSKMPWPPGSRPVMKVDHATGLCGGIVVPSGANDPPSRRAARSSACGPRASGRASARSRARRSPSTMTRVPGRGAPAARQARGERRTRRSDDAAIAQRATALMPSPPRRADGRPCRRRLDAEQAQRGRRDVDERRVARRRSRGCRRTRRARAADRCSGRRSTPSRCPRRPARRRRRSRSPTTCGSRRCSR